MVSGEPEAIERIRPMISLWGRTLTVASDKPGAAQVLKLTNNILSAVALAATAEAFVMGAKGGLDPEVMLGAINAGSGRNTVFALSADNLHADRKACRGKPDRTSNGRQIGEAGHSAGCHRGPAGRSLQ
jgi:3-hydroxyisobutyrate dehydrogenase-like beta-hydroxyacid dehydrogenase